MAVTRERFEQGLTYEAYKAQMTRNRERLEENERALAFEEEELAFFRGLGGPVYVLALAEDWCGDVINNLPVVAGLARETGALNLRVFLRDQNLDIMDQYLKEGKYRSIPVLVFFDEDFRELGYWIERPKQISALQEAMRRDLFANDPLLSQFAPDTSPGELPEEARMRLGQAFGAFREEHRAFSDREVVREIRALISGVERPAEEPVSAAANIAAMRERASRPRAQHPVKVSITYCAVCGYEPQTLELTSALMKEFLYDLAAIELIPWQDGAFDVAVDGEVVHSMYRDGGFPESAAIIGAVRERLGVR
jgi:selT/selW/selH-like putative selenoprotein